MDLRKAIRVILDNFGEWDYEDRGYDYSSCRSCGWNTKDDKTRDGMSHREGCELRAALDLLEALQEGT